MVRIQGVHMNLEENVYPYFRLTSHFNIPFNYECRQQTIVFLIVPVTLSPTERMDFYHITFVADLLKYHIHPYFNITSY